MKEAHNATIQYYDGNAKYFAANTRMVDCSSIQNRFISKLPSQAAILDFGCGSGRDTKYFMGKGFCVEAIDGSEELCRLASEYTGIPVRQMYFQEFCENARYDGIWACASLLHLPQAELPAVMDKMIVALKPNGIIYMSFKYGTQEEMRNGRYFTDMTEQKFHDLMSGIDELQIEDEWITFDARPERSEEKWLNIILRKM